MTSFQCSMCYIYWRSICNLRFASEAFPSCVWVEFQFPLYLTYDLVPSAERRAGAVAYYWFDLFTNYPNSWEQWLTRYTSLYANNNSYHYFQFPFYPIFPWVFLDDFPYRFQDFLTVLMIFIFTPLKSVICTLKIELIDSCLVDRTLFDDICWIFVKEISTRA